MKNRKTSDAAEIIYKRFFEGRPDRIAGLERERKNFAIARRLYDLRDKAGLTQGELAKRVGTSASVISRLEDGDYEGHSLTMLQRVAAALGQDVEVKFVKAKRAAH